MANSELHEILNSLLQKPVETELVEFKEAKDNYDFSKLGKYFSALSNEANLKNKPNAWLIFGVENKHHNIVGTNYRNTSQELDSLKREIADKTTNRITFMDIYDLVVDNERVIMFKIPPAPKGIPVAFEGHYYGRDGESLVSLNIEEIERIRSQSSISDWSAGIIESADISDLDPEAIKVARNNYKNKFPDQSAEVDEWDDKTFLNKAKLTIRGQITRTALLLLGKSESDHFLSPADAKIRWILKDSAGNEKDYFIACCPLLLAVDTIYSKIRNLKYRYMKEGTLFPEEIDKYEPYAIREAINNCIAHQDYELGGRINVVEMDDQLIFTNLGSFIPGSIINAVKENAPAEYYRNRFLAVAMFNLKMVDTVGGGIRRMFNYQRKRFFPLPDYDISNNRVKLTLTGKILDMQYAKLLAQKDDLTLDDIIMLDKVQKKQRLSDIEEKHLKQKKLIEGRKPNYYIGVRIAQQTDQKAKYSKNRAFDKQYYLDLIIKALKEHESLNRKDITDLLSKKLPEWMTEKQQENKITNLLSELRLNKKIKNAGVRKAPKWVLS